MNLVEDLVARIAGLSIPDLLRAAAKLMDADRGDLAEVIIDSVALEIAAVRIQRARDLADGLGTKP